MKLTKTKIEGVIVIEPVVHNDHRGFFLETYHTEKYASLKAAPFVQDNHSRSVKGVIRGLHYQVRNYQAQLLTVLSGRVFDVVVDVRRDSKTFGKWLSFDLREDGVRQIYMAPGIAHGFCVLSDVADLHYKCTQLYDGSTEGGLLWNDPKVGITWPITNPIISPRDAAFRKLEEIPESDIPKI
jgi:dTDP-4-dehydrorhamnose 3,5-epimerase